ncbi:Pls/PosA family non-ribosomal peptide synthetase [Falsarthrobacter nasiphocae]|uniref:Non-ribosomal peptide synthetase-like protein n=1 Tax=Falsarthrobacter nasiphocae TaxID=189863 RepID=A0AAE4C6L4_9MICC|nr:Pls/PosA family non-ribosomal peptide synthetase [Falsarthrobacter nasiphocae]MDR6892703.1 non-ribosomal peptide synthetase-like protein [Falsarthrobacter nasiphocae]
MTYAPQLPGSQLTPAPRTLWEVFLSSVAAHPEALALDDSDQALTYAQLHEAVAERAAELAAAGLGAGDRIGVRVPSGTRDLYIGILAIISLGAAYVPVDADDPDERARLVFSEADVAGIVTAEGISVTRPRDTPLTQRPPELDDDVWVIFTSGSTGKPKGVAISQRSAAAFVDAEAALFLQDRPLGPGDRVLAGLSVGFDASCEEMWLAWGHGACLVPAPRALVRSGVDLGPWLVSRRINVVSTVPTLAALWPAEALESVRLLIFGGEACPPELATRLAVEGREVWNTYGPTEATVVACAAPLTGTGPVRIGLPLNGWDLAVVDEDEIPVAPGESGQLIIGGVGLGRYLDPDKDAEKYAPMPTLGWDRAYRSGDLVTYDPEGLLFNGRADDQVKLGGRRIELGEVEAALQALPGVRGAAAAVKGGGAAPQVLVGYLALESGAEWSEDEASARLRTDLPAALVPRLAVVDSLPTKSSGKVDRDALPWPLAGAGDDEADPSALAALSPDARWVVEAWSAALSAPPGNLDADFFALGGGSLQAAQLVAVLRQRYPEVTVADVYDRPRVGALAEHLAGTHPAAPAAEPRAVRATPVRSQVAQTLVGIPALVLVGLKWFTWLSIGLTILAWAGAPTPIPVPHPLVTAALWLVIASPVGRMGVSVLAARALLAGIRPGQYPRGGRMHMRLWTAEQIANVIAPVSLGSAFLVPYYARALGASIGRDVDLHSVPPVTGLLRVGDGASIEPDVDLTGWWVDGDVVHIGEVTVGAGAHVASRSVLLPGSKVSRGAHVAQGSAVTGTVPAERRAAGAPAVPMGKAKASWPSQRPARSRAWAVVFAASSAALELLPFLAAVPGLLLVAWATGVVETGLLHARLAPLAWSVPLAALMWFVLLAALIVGTVRLLAIGLTPGYVPVRSRVAWQAWTTERLLDVARERLFPIYASLFTPIWLRLLGAKVGRNVEISTVLCIPSMTTIADGAFLADDTMVATYELGGGWMHVGPAKVGKRSFLGNSGMAQAGRKVPKDSLVAVLSAAPDKAKSGSSWLGSPPARLRRTAVEADAELTFRPDPRLKRARGAWELLRGLPVIVTALLAAGVVVGLSAVWHGLITAGVGETAAWLLTALSSGIIAFLASLVAAASAVAAKWLFVGRIRPGEHPLFSSFIWRNELQDTFVELVAAPWFAYAALGTPAMTWWMRALGANIGRGVWLETYWLPEADLVRLGDGSSVNRGTVLQTHLFHDRVMSIDAVTLEAGSTLGPHSVILPAARLGEGSTIGPASLVMRGDSIPGSTRWMGNPVSVWREPTT